MKTQVISKKHQSFYPSSGVAIGGNSVVINNTNNDVTTNNEFIVDVVVTSNITLSATQTIDGITLIVGQKVLVTAQTSAVNNGIYIVQSGAWIRTFNLYSTMLIKVREGTLGANSLWMLSAPDIDTITPGTDALTFIRIDNGFIPNNVVIQSASGMRTALGLGTIAVQNSNNVVISGGFAIGLTQLTVTGSNSTISVGKSNSINLVSGAGTGVITLRNQNNTASYALYGGGVHEFISAESTTPFTFTLNNATNSSPFRTTTRNRTAGTASRIDRKVVNTTSALSASDIVQDEWNITPTTGVAVENQIAHIVTNASATVPDTAMQVSLTIAGALKRVMRFVDRGIQLWNGSTQAIRLLVSSSLSVSYDLILPNTAPVGGQIITHDGTGQQFFENHVYTCLQQVNSNITMQNNYHYAVFDDTNVRRVLTLPTNANSRTGMYIRVSRSPYNLDSFRIAQNAVQRIYVDETSTTEGIVGYIDSDSIDTSLLLYCFSTDQSTYAMWQVITKVGNIIIN